MPAKSADAAPTWNRAAGAGPVLSHPAPFSLDTILALLNRTLFKPHAILLLPLVAWAHGIYTGTIPHPSTALQGSASAQEIATTLWQQVRGSVTSVPALRKLFVFIVLLNLHRVATRYVKNLGQFARDPTDFKKDVIVITGGSAGIGRAMVELLSHKHRAKIAVLDLAEPTYAPAPAGAPEILYIKTDVSNAESVAAAAEKIKATFPGSEPAVLINNAGIVTSGTILTTNLDAVQRVWRVNALSHYVTLQRFLPGMLAAGHGHIISVASSASYMSIPELSVYATSKAAAMSLHECLIGELRSRYGPNGRKIRTTVVAPTKVMTALGSGLEDQKNQFTTPTLEPIQVAERVVRALENGLSDHVIMPALMNILPVVSRAPAWMRRGIELIGDTDNNVTDKGLERALKHGYGKDFTNEEDKKLWQIASSRSVKA